MVILIPWSSLSCWTVCSCKMILGLLQCTTLSVCKVLGFLSQNHCSHTRLLSTNLVPSYKINLCNHINASLKFKVIGNGRLFFQIHFTCMYISRSISYYIYIMLYMSYQFIYVMSCQVMYVKSNLFCHAIHSLGHNQAITLIRQLIYGGPEEKPYCDHRRVSCYSISSIYWRLRSKANTGK